MSSATVARPRPGPRRGRIRIGRFTLNLRDRDTVIYLALAIGALAFPTVADFVTGGAGGSIVLLAADAGVYVLLALGLNVVVGFAGLLDLGYAAFFAIGAYTYALMASGALFHTPLHHAIHIPFWLLLIVGVMIAATAGALLGAPTLRLRGDYLAIVTLGFGEIVPRVFRNAGDWTGGINGLSALVSPENFQFQVSITILVMIVLGGMGSMPGVIVGSLTVYLILFKILPDAPNQVHSLLATTGFTAIDQPTGDWPGLGEFVSRLKFLLFGLILVTTMLLRPGGLIPSRAEIDVERAAKETSALGLEGAQG